MQPHPVLSHRYETDQDKPAYIRSLFDAGAPFYDRVTSVGFLGTGQAYRGMALRRAGIGPGARILDCATGTGLVAAAAIKLGASPADIVCLDVSPGMLKCTKEKLNVKTVEASADSIPLEDDQFDFVTMGYGLRHVAALETTFGEYFRVLRPGGKAFILEITVPENRVGKWFFKIGFRDVSPALTRLFTGSKAAQEMMRYYWETMDAAVRPETIMDAMRSAGFEDVGCHVVGSVFSEYTGTKPA